MLCERSQKQSNMYYGSIYIKQEKKQLMMLVRKIDTWLLLGGGGSNQEWE